jgi:hypothetical protein
LRLQLPSRFGLTIGSSHPLESISVHSFLSTPIINAFVSPFEIWAFIRHPPYEIGYPFRAFGSFRPVCTFLAANITPFHLLHPLLVGSGFLHPHGHIISNMIVSGCLYRERMNIWVLPSSDNPCLQCLHFIFLGIHSPPSCYAWLVLVLLSHVLPRHLWWDSIPAKWAFVLRSSHDFTFRLYSSYHP